MSVHGKTKGGSADAFLVLDDDVRLAASMRRLLSCHGDVTVTHSCTEAIAARPAAGIWTAVFLDFELPDGDAFRVLDALEARGERVPAVIITGHLADDVANRAFAIGVKVLAKPIGAEHVRVFLESLRGDGPTRDVVDAWSLRYGLTRAETDVLRDGVLGVDRGQLAERRGISETTVRTHVRHILEKTGDASLSDAIQRALREVIGLRGR